MPGWTLRLSEDAVGAGGRLPSLAAANRVLYVVAGEVLVAGGGSETRVAAGAAWHGAGACTATAGAAGATVLRWELVRDGRPPPTGRVVLEHPIDLDPARAWLMRADRVDFAPGGVAPPHGHQGGGIRRLLAGALEVAVGEHPPRRMGPGDAWFESGREPVLATASPDAPTSFLRVSILPREIRGRSSIVYVDPADAARGKPRQYTVFVDEPIELA